MRKWNNVITIYHSSLKRLQAQARNAVVDGEAQITPLITHPSKEHIGSEAVGTGYTGYKEEIKRVATCTTRDDGWQYDFVVLFDSIGG